MVVLLWCTTAEAVVYERARPLKRPEEGGGGGDKSDRVGVGNVIPGVWRSLHAPNMYVKLVGLWGGGGFNITV